MRRALFEELQGSPLTDELRAESLWYTIPNLKVRRPVIKNKEATLLEIIHSNKSIARYGDGEIMVMAGLGIAFQEYDAVLARRLQEIVHNHDENLMVGIPHIFYYPYLYPDMVVNNHLSVSKQFNIEGVALWRNRLNKWIDIETVYYSTDISGLTSEQFVVFRDFLRDKHVVLTLCKEAFDAYQHNLFDTAKKIDYVFIPNKHAFRQYDAVLQKLSSFPKKALHILMAGPAADLWAVDLCAQGFRALDLGHIAKTYDYAMRGKKADAKFWEPDE